MLSYQENKKSRNRNVSGFIGGQGGIRTLDTLLTYTRVPVVRLRPTQPPVHILLPAIEEVVRVTGLEPVRRSTRPSNVPVCQFQHTRILFFALSFIIIAENRHYVNSKNDISHF